MFEIGAQYKFCMIEGGNEGTFVGTVKEYEHPLIKLEDTPSRAVRFISREGSGESSEGHPIPSQPGRIINVTSPNFVSAQRQQTEE